MRIVDKDGKLSAPLADVPRVVAGGQAGMLDVRLDNALWLLTDNPAGRILRVTPAKR